jgi:8-oxo-dGTP pyrophosphatase MutT (NUDIX family)
MTISGRIRVEEVTTLSSDWYILKKTTFSFLRGDGTWQRQSRETYDRGNGATILLYDDDLLIEAPAGLLDDARPEDRIRAEVEEETGFRVSDVRQVFDAFMSPGSVTERLHFFVGSYSAVDQVSEGGGNAEEGEDIERLEPTIEEALEMIRDGRIRDGKTIMLLQYAALHIFKG